MSNGLGRGWLYFPDGTHDAWFDYATCIVGINEPRLPEFDVEVVGERVHLASQHVAAIHESVHVLQAAALPWMMHFCLSWRKHVLDVRAEQMPNGLKWGTLGGLLKILSPHHAQETKELLALLDGTGEAGFSVLDLLESHALYGQLSVLGQNTTKDLSFYFHHNGTQPRYRFAYDWTRAHLGDEQALAGFGAIVASAFCFYRPAAVFEELVKHLTAFALTPGVQLSIPALTDAARAHGFEDEFFGLPSDVAAEFSRAGDLPSALQSRIVLQVADDNASTVESLIATRDGLVHAVLSMRPTTLYQPDEENGSGVVLGPTMSFYETVGWGPGDTPYGLDFKAYQSERFIMGISQRLIATYSSSRPVDVHPRFRWLAGLSWREHQIDFPADVDSDDPTENVKLAASVMSELPLNALGDGSKSTETTMQILGRFRLLFQIDTPLEAWQYPWVRGVIRAFEQLSPAYPLLLTSDQTVLWFGSLSDLEAVSAGGLEVSHRSAEDALIRYLAAVKHLEGQAQCDFSPLVQRTLGIWFSAEIREPSPWRGAPSGLEPASE